MVSIRGKLTRRLKYVALNILVLLLSIWILSPYIWYPSVVDIDTYLATKEADKIFSQCIDEVNVDSSLPAYIWVHPEETPYIFGLIARGRNWKGFGIICSEVIHIPMWNDWWAPDAGIYVLQEGKTLPKYIDLYTNNIADRVYKWTK